MSPRARNLVHLMHLRGFGMKRAGRNTGARTDDPVQAKHQTGTNAAKMLIGAIARSLAHCQALQPKSSQKAWGEKSPRPGRPVLYFRFYFILSFPPPSHVGRSYRGGQSILMRSLTCCIVSNPDVLVPQLISVTTVLAKKAGHHLRVPSSARSPPVRCA